MFADTVRQEWRWCSSQEVHGVVIGMVAQLQVGLLSTLYGVWCGLYWPAIPPSVS